jgi:hypothetical protein
MTVADPGLGLDDVNSRTTSSPTACPTRPSRSCVARRRCGGTTGRIADLELTGPPERMRTNFTNALKRMPVRVTAKDGTGD